MQSKRFIYVGIISFMLICIFTACLSKEEHNSNEDFSEFKDRNAIDKMLKTKKTDYIEKKVLIKLKTIIKQSSTKEMLPAEFINLISLTRCALGNDTLNYLDSLKARINKNRSYKIAFEYQVIEVVKERLKLISLLEGYVPKNELEKSIVEEIRFYPALNSIKDYWSDEHDKKYGVKSIPLVKKFKLGPLKNNNYIYIHCYAHDSLLVPGLKKYNYFEVSDESKGMVLSYDLKFDFYPRKETSEKSIVTKDFESRK